MKSAIISSLLPRAIAVLLLAASSALAAPTPMEFSAEAKARQSLVQVALGREPADLIIRGATVLNVFTQTWEPDQDIVVKGQRIAWVGPRGGWKGVCANIHDASGLWAVPGFGESHKHIESTHISPENEAALVIPQGNTWTIEASHEFSNVNGGKNVELWLMPRALGSPLKIFPSLGSATPPTAYETGGGYYGYKEIRENMAKDLMVVGLDEVMDWPAVSNPKHPGHQRIWENIQATYDSRGVIEGHGSGLRDIGVINAFAAAGLSSDHEIRLGDEAWDKLQRGIFVQLKRANITIGVDYLLKKGLKDWSGVCVVTDDRDVVDALEIGTMDYNIKLAIAAGAPLEAAYMMGTYNPARHSHVEHLVGSIAPGRFADVVLLEDPKTVKIKRVFADGRLASEGSKYLLPIPDIKWPDWATKTINIGREMVAKDFEIRAPAGRTTVSAAIQSGFYTDMEQKRADLPVVDGVVQRDIAKDIIKLATINRYHGNAKIGKIFWTGLGPKTPNSALATSLQHDLHNVAVIGTSDEAMAIAVNAVAANQGGWALVKEGKLIATVRYEIGGLMTAKEPHAAAPEMAAMIAAADSLEWIGAPGFPARAGAMLITCSPYTWRLVVPYEGNPDGLVNLVTGEIQPIVR